MGWQELKKDYRAGAKVKTTGILEQCIWTRYNLQIEGVVGQGKGSCGGCNSCCGEREGRCRFDGSIGGKGSGTRIKSCELIIGYVQSICIWSFCCIIYLEIQL